MMERRRFFVWSAVGAVLWVISVTLLGYFLGAAFPWLGENIDYVTIAILAFSAIPVAWEWWRHQRQGAKKAKGVPAATEVAAEVESPVAD